jgi:hypothetical protein
MMRFAFDESKLQLDKVRKEQREEKRERAKATFKVTENLANEREDLVQELHELRSARC